MINLKILNNKIIFYIKNVKNIMFTDNKIKIYLTYTHNFSLVNSAKNTSIIDEQLKQIYPFKMQLFLHPAVVIKFNNIITTIVLTHDGVQQKINNNFKDYKQPIALMSSEHINNLKMKQLSSQYKPIIYQYLDTLSCSLKITYYNTTHLEENYSLNKIIKDKKKYIIYPYQNNNDSITNINNVISPIFTEKNVEYVLSNNTQISKFNIYAFFKNKTEVDFINKEVNNYNKKLNDINLFKEIENINILKNYFEEIYDISYLQSQEHLINLFHNDINSF